MISRTDPSVRPISFPADQQSRTGAWPNLVFDISPALRKLSIRHQSRSIIEQALARTRPSAMRRATDTEAEARG
jgi:hypothetical protein